MALFICSEVMFFVAFFWHSSKQACSQKNSPRFGGCLAAQRCRDFPTFGLPLMNTLILLLSGCTVTWAHHALREGDRDGLIKGLGYTILLGLLFTGVQAYEYGCNVYLHGRHL